MLVLFSKTRFAYAYLMFYRFYINSANLLTMVRHETWEDVTSNIDSEQVGRFVQIVQNMVLMNQIKYLLKLVGPLSNIIHHSKGHMFQALYFLPLYFSFGHLISDWSAVTTCFDQATHDKLCNIYVKRWMGFKSKVGAFHLAHLVPRLLLEKNVQVARVLCLKHCRVQCRFQIHLLTIFLKS